MSTGNTRTGRGRRLGLAAAVVTLAPLAVLLPTQPAQAVTSPVVTLSHDGTGARSTYTLSVTLQSALPDGGRIRAVAPAGTDFGPCTAYVTDNTDPADSGGAYCNTSGNANTVVITPYNGIGAGHNITVTVRRVDNPAAPVANATWQVSTTAETTPVATAPYSIVNRSVSKPTVSLSTHAPGAEATYTMGFTTSPSGSLVEGYSPRINVVAPNGTNFGPCSATITDLTDSAGSGGAYCNTGQNSNTLVVTPYNEIGANHRVVVQVRRVANPTVPNPGYTWRVSTSADQTPVESEPFPIGSQPAPTATPSSSATSSPQPSTAPTTAPAPGSGGALQLTTSTPDIQPNQVAKVVASGNGNGPVELLCYSRPSTEYKVVRSGEMSGGSVTFSLLPGTNTRCYAQRVGNSGTASPGVVISVHTTLSLSAVRTSGRSYVFQGRNLPRRAGQLITLYRIDGQGREVRAANVSTDSSGIYRIPRTFTGAGTFTFVTRTSQTLTNAPGRSNPYRITIG